MEILIEDLVSRFYAFIWPMIRVSAFLLVAPFFSLDTVSLRIRIALGFLLTWLIFPLIEIPNINPISLEGLSIAFDQALIGVTMGVVLQVVSAAIVVGGQAISNSMGLGMANMVDPNIGNVPLLSVFLLIISTLIFLGLGGHLLIIIYLVETFKSMPIGQEVIPIDFLRFIVDWSSMVFLGALLLALPIIVSLLFINLGIGVITRAAPALNIFAVGFPAMILAGIVLLSISMTSIAYRIQWLWLQSFDTLKTGLGIS